MSEGFAKIQKATSNQQQIERNGLICLYIVPWSGRNRILQNPDLKIIMRQNKNHSFGNGFYAARQPYGKRSNGQQAEIRVI